MPVQPSCLGSRNSSDSRCSSAGGQRRCGAAPLAASHRGRSRRRFGASRVARQGAYPLATGAQRGSARGWSPGTDHAGHDNPPRTQRPRPHRLEGCSAIDRHVAVHAALKEHERRVNTEPAHPLMRALELPYPLLVGRVSGGEYASLIRTRVGARVLIASGSQPRRHRTGYLRSRWRACWCARSPGSERVGILAKGRPAARGQPRPSSEAN